MFAYYYTEKKSNLPCLTVVMLTQATSNSRGTQQCPLCNNNTSHGILQAFVQAMWPWYSTGLDDETVSPEPEQDNGSETNESRALIEADEENVEAHEENVEVHELQPL